MNVEKLIALAVWQISLPILYEFCLVACFNACSTIFGHRVAELLRLTYNRIEVYILQIKSYKIMNCPKDSKQSLTSIYISLSQLYYRLNESSAGIFLENCLDHQSSTLVGTFL